jgi:putative SOS response-associated peptidase YedK
VCGRYQRRSDKQKIAEAFHLGNVDGLALELAPDYNVAPQTMQPVVIWDEAYGTRTLHMMFWKFLPPFVTDSKNYKLATINAQSEKLMESSVWQDSFLKRRCLIPADNFIEWRRIDAKTKLPYAFAMKDDQPFALGGVWRHWRSPDRKALVDQLERYRVPEGKPAPAVQQRDQAARHVLTGGVAGEPRQDTGTTRAEAKHARRGRNQVSRHVHEVENGPQDVSKGVQADPRVCCSAVD